MIPNQTSLERSSGGLSPNPAGRENQVLNQFNQLVKTVDEVSNLAKEISLRLSPILRSEQETACEPSNKTPPEEYLVPLADQIRNVCRQLNDAALVLRSVIQRSEI